MYNIFFLNNYTHNYIRIIGGNAAVRLLGRKNAIFFFRSFFSLCALFCTRYYNFLLNSPPCVLSANNTPIYVRNVRIGLCNIHVNRFFQTYIINNVMIVRRVYAVMCRVRMPI
jgi:hypothetical protein